jgi:hypothetical protein
VFAGAAHLLAMLHPPGTPLFFVLFSVWAKLLSFLPFAAATNLFSSACTAAAVGLTTLWIARATKEPLAGLAAGIAAGAMSTVWQNATETEVYAASLLLSVAAIVAADRAGRTGDARFTLLTAYLLALAVPVHLSALVAAPVAVLLAASRPAGGFDGRTALVLSGVSVATAGVGRMSVSVISAGLVLILLAAVPRRDALGGGDSRRARVGVAVGAVMVACVALSAVALIIRSRFDPAINQDNPHTWSQLAYTVAQTPRRCRAVASPRADLAAVGELVRSTPTGSGRCGSRPAWSEHLARARDEPLPGDWDSPARRVASTARRRTWRAVLLLFACGSARRDLVPESARGAHVRVVVRSRRRGARGARQGLLLHARLLGVGDLGRHGSRCVGAALLARVGRRGRRGASDPTQLERRAWLA